MSKSAIENLMKETEEDNELFNFRKVVGRLN